MPTLGETLRDARNGKKLKMSDVEARIRVPRATLEALERDDYDALPDEIKAKGAIRNYALLLGLSPDEMWGKYRGARPAAVATRPFAAVQTATRLTPLAYVTVSALVMILALVALLVTHVIVI